MSSGDTSVRTDPCDVAALNTTVSRILAGTESPRCSGRESPHPNGRTFDMDAFSETLARIQRTSLVVGDAE
jgi:dual specificity phosphatase 12